MSTVTEELSIAQLEPRLSDVKTTFKVVERGEIREVVSRRDGTTNRVADVIVGDNTGTVVISAWNETIDKLEPGVTYDLSNAHTGLYRGHLRLKLNRESVLEQSEESIDEINEENDISSVNHQTRDNPYSRQHNRSSYYGSRSRGRSSSW